MNYTTIILTIDGEWKEDKDLSELLNYIKRIKFEYPDKYLSFSLGLDCLYMPGQLEAMLAGAKEVLGIIGDN